MQHFTMDGVKWATKVIRFHPATGRQWVFETMSESRAAFNERLANWNRLAQGHWAYWEFTGVLHKIGDSAVLDGRMTLREPLQ
jgi:hypothetical protein